MSQTLELILKAQNQTAAAFKEVQSSSDKLKGDLLSLAANTLTFAAAFKVATDALKAQAEQEAAINSLNLALANQGNLLGDTSARLQDFASELQRTTTFSDDAVIAAQAILASFGMNEEQIKRTTVAAADFAAATGTDLRTAIDILGKAYAGNTALLGRYGIVVDENLSKSEKFDAAIDQLGKRFSGAAAAATQNYTGSLLQAKNAMNEAQEGLGKLLGELAGSGRPFAQAIAFGNVMADVFGVQLVLALGELRATFSETMAAIATLIARQMDNFAKLPLIGERFKEAAKFLDDFALALDRDAAAFREESNQAALAAGKLQTFTNGVAQSTRAVRDHKEELADAKRAYEEMMDSIHAAWKMIDAEREREAKAALDAFKRAEAERLRIRKETVDAELDVLEKTWAAQQQGMKDLDDLLRKMHEEDKKRAEEREEHLQDLAQEFAGMSDILTATGDLFVAMGMKADSALVKTIDLFSGLADATANVFARLAQGDILGAVAAGISGIANAIGSLFGDKEQEQVNDMRDAFLDLQGGFVSLQEKLLAITDQDLVKRVFDAKTVDEFNAAVAEVNRLFDLQAQAEEKLIEAMDRYGLTIEEMGPKWAQQELNKMAMQLFEDYELLTAAGADHNAVLAKMAPSMQEYVNTAIKAGSTIPESLRPVIQAMIDQGLLLDENGVAFTSLEDAGLSFAESLEAGLGRTIDAIKELVRTLQRLYSLGPPDIPAPPPPGGGGGHGGGGHGHAAGWARITDWGVPAMLHGTPSNPEYVLRGNQLGEVVDAAVDRAVRAAMRGGGGGRTVIENRIFLGGQELRDWLSRQRTAGYIE